VTHKYLYLVELDQAIELPWCNKRKAPNVVSAR
jgi:hypothetical protein